MKSSLKGAIGADAALKAIVDAGAAFDVAGEFGERLLIPVRFLDEAGFEKSASFLIGNDIGQLK